jgi:hypothetical protein
LPARNEEEERVSSPKLCQTRKLRLFGRREEGGASDDSASQGDPVSVAPTTTTTSPLAITDGRLMPSFDRSSCPVCCCDASCVPLARAQSSVLVVFLLILFIRTHHSKKKSLSLSLYLLIIRRVVSACVFLSSELRRTMRVLRALFDHKKNPLFAYTHFLISDGWDRRIIPFFFIDTMHTPYPGAVR